MFGTFLSDLVGSVAGLGEMTEHPHESSVLRGVVVDGEAPTVGLTATRHEGRKRGEERESEIIFDSKNTSGYISNSQKLPGNTSRQLMDAFGAGP